ncbi:hypothetical protein PV327_005866 [Microctonus hyperodae]|uniref:DUF3752 domain-containing protein n=1 Tax=Microctonus hyperodae TaxID=165561 RepID=A0AA39G291_MICHY|nr:hypothetical protein PV327_005866 [Microctonus hyperodae]
MTTMDSDSESQDSDEGRRFRFEATRKITSDNIHDKGRKPESFKPYEHDRRSRSRDRSSRRERKDERSSNERVRKEGTSSRDDVRGSKDRKSLLKDEPRRFRDDEFTRHRDRDIKYIHKEPRDCLLRHDSRSRDRRESKSRDDKPQTMRRRSPEKSYDKAPRYDFKCRDRREKHYSRERSCQRERSRDDNNKKVDVAADSQECKDLNLSDFDIVSDTDGDSDTSIDHNGLSENKSNRQICDVTRINTVDEHEAKVKNRRNGDKSSRPSNSNHDAHALSDLLLGNASTSASPTCSYSNSLNERKYIRKYCTELDDHVAKDKDNDNADDYNVTKIDNDTNEVFSYGPQLPPSENEILQKKLNKELIQPRIIGPSLPNEYRKYISPDDNENGMNDEEDTFGPALPPHLQNTKSEVLKIVETFSSNKSRDDNNDRMDIDNILADDEDDIDDFEAIGPLPVDHPGIKSDRIQQQLEYRARLIKEELAEIDNCESKKREEWMIELPDIQTANLGLAPRKFRSRPGPDMSDRSSWTDTPMDRARKQREQQMDKRPRDHRHETEVRVEKPHSRNEKSLLELHQKKMNKKKKKEEKAAKDNGRPVRRPFDRDVDLKANHFDEARKRRMMMKATTLDDRFSRVYSNDNIYEFSDERDDIKVKSLYYKKKFVECEILMG